MDAISWNSRWNLCPSLYSQRELEGGPPSFSFIKECMALNPNIVCLNYLDYQKNIGDIIRNTENKLIVIDNADVLLDDDTRKHIALDDKNQYLIIGRNPKNLFVTKENLFELVSEKQGEQTVLRIENYLQYRITLFHCFLL